LTPCAVNKTGQEFIPANFYASFKNPSTGTCIFFSPGRRLLCASVLFLGFGALGYEDAARSTEWLKSPTNSLLG
jgi:hypothetical protein